MNNFVKISNDMKTNDFDAIVVGGGHAGIEACFALANKKHHVALITFSKDRLASMPCNPSIGGPAKGIITREIDALGGMQGIFADKSMIQIKILNDSKGPAVKAYRAQIDKEKYSKIVLEEALNNPYIHIVEGTVEDLIVEDNVVEGVVLDNGSNLHSKVVIIATGTYLDSYILRGDTKISSGPDGQKTSQGLSNFFKNNQIKTHRFKTGTPPRVATKSIDFSQIEKEVLSPTNITFSNRSNIKLENQISCYLTYTTPLTHQIINNNLNKSFMYSGQVVGVGPRYCPSIEDKIVRFSDKSRHQIFYEPETLEGDVIYIQGFSTSMPIDVQEKMVKSLPGMANAIVLKWAYAIEYDMVDPFELLPNLEMKKISNLFLAGQINGTSGYEEAAAQGLIAGINAALKLENNKSLILSRSDAYIGVLIDDLVTKGTNEPYRMLTSRAEYRLLLRNDNVDERLAKIGYEIGILPREIYLKVVEKYNRINLEINKWKETYISSNSDLAKKYNITSGPSLYQVASRPEIDISDLPQFEFLEELVIKIRLEGYIKKQETEAKKMIRMNLLKIPKNINYDMVLNLATEARQKFKLVKPETIGQASRISGINPADIQMIMFHLESKRNNYDN